MEEGGEQKKEEFSAEYVVVFINENSGSPSEAENLSLNLKLK